VTKLALATWGCALLLGCSKGATSVSQSGDAHPATGGTSTASGSTRGGQGPDAGVAPTSGGATSQSSAGGASGNGSAGDGSDPSAGGEPPTGGAGATSTSTAGAAATNGGGGAVDGGATLPADISDEVLCASCCASTGPFELPGALCEDWSFPERPEPAEFCEPPTSTGCTERCVERLTVVSDACRLALRDAVPCVAALGFYPNGAITTCPFEGCRYELYRVSSDCNGLREELAEARALWDSVATSSYTYTYGYQVLLADRSATVEVVDDRAAVVDGYKFDPPYTVPDLFDIVSDTIDNGAVPVVEYDATAGYPTSIERYIGDCNEKPADAFTASDLTFE